jgi:hypothetical protein
MVLRRRGRRWVLVVLGSSSSVRSDGNVLVDVVEGTALIPCGLNNAFTSASVTCLYRDPMGYIWYKVITEILCLKRGVKGDPNMPYTLAYSVTMMIQKIC